MNWKRSPVLVAAAYANIGSLIAGPAMSLSVTGGFSLGIIGHSLIYGLVFGNCIAITAGLLVPRMVHWAAARQYFVPLALIIGSVAAATIGCFAAEAILTVAGVTKPPEFWSQLLGILRITALLAAVFGMGSFFYASTREQLRQVSAKLHEKELAEERAKKLAVEAQLASLASRLHPHFLFNSLNSVAALIRIDPMRAEEMLTRLSQLLRNSLENTKTALVPLEQEIQTTKEYLAIEGMRLGDKIRTRIDIPAAVRSAKVPPFCVQALAENALKHGIANSREHGEITITAEPADGSVHIRVSDTGPGFALSDMRAGHGLDTLTARLDALYGSNARLNVLRDAGRCTVEVVVPEA